MLHQRRSASRAATGRTTTEDHAGPSLDGFDEHAAGPERTGEPSTFDPGGGDQTTHAPVTPYGAVNAGDAPESAFVDGEREVQVIHGAGSPLELCGAPAE
jgi:hypothetical protein